MNSAEQLKKIEDLVAVGKKEGGEFFQVETTLPSKGYFYKPCFFNNVSSAHSLVKTEIFGPVLVIQSFRTPDEAILKANDTPYGLAAGIWSEKGSKVHYVASQLKAGVIWANTYNKFDAASPFGGMKESGFGREGGLQGLHPYLEVEGA
ncbi:MAG: aldehyde dehydrogenase family protein [Bacteriovoracaceae bacterium]